MKHIIKTLRMLRQRKFLAAFLYWAADKYETMNGRGLCPVYLERWTLFGWLFKRFGVGLYLHHFMGDDWSLDLHDHPRRFTSIGLSGWYFEDVGDKDGNIVETKKFTAPWIRSFPANHVHRVRAAECGNTWTLVWVGRPTQEWGFFSSAGWIHFRSYFDSGKVRTSC